MRYGGVVRLALATGVVLATALGANSATTAATAGAPLGTPALDRMGLMVGDLAARGSIRRQGYVKDRNFAAYYVREFKPGASLGKSALSGLESNVGVTATRADAVKLVGRVAATLRSKSARKTFVRGVLQAAGWDQASLRLVFGGIRGIAGGDAAFMAPIAVSLPGRVRLALVLEVVRVDRAVQLLYLLGAPNAPIVPTEATRLVDVVAARMRAELIPANTVLPIVSGMAQEGRTLSSDPGSWTNAPSAYAFQWLRCGAAANCVPIDGAVSTSYLLTASDVGSMLELSVVATNAAGSSQPSVSLPTLPVVATAGVGRRGRARA